jgi:hypothetical protein
MHEANGNTGLARVVWWSALGLDGFVLFFTMCAASANNGGGVVLLMLSMAVITGLALWYVVQQGLWFEWQLERTWKRACAGLGGNFRGEGMSVVRSVRAGLQSRGQYVPTQTKTIYPKLRNVRGNRQAWTAVIKPFYGQNVDDYNKQADRLALAFNVPFVTFDKTEDGLIRIRAGAVPVPVAYEYQEKSW